MVSLKRASSKSCSACFDRRTRCLHRPERRPGRRALAGPAPRRATPDIGGDIRCLPCEGVGGSLGEFVLTDVAGGRGLGQELAEGLILLRFGLQDGRPPALHHGIGGHGQIVELQQGGRGSVEGRAAVSCRPPPTGLSSTNRSTRRNRWCVISTVRSGCSLNHR